jgi:hypothetical protein
VKNEYDNDDAGARVSLANPFAAFFQRAGGRDLAANQMAWHHLRIEIRD